MQGARIPDVRRDRPEGWEAWERRGTSTYMEPVAPPGAYMKVLREDGTLWCWYVRSPDGKVATLWTRSHAITEFADGTITVWPSIVFPGSGGWHGFLRCGEWSA